MLLSKRVGESGLVGKVLQWESEGSRLKPYQALGQA